MNDEVTPISRAVRVTFGDHQFRARASPRPLSEWESELLGLSVHRDAAAPGELAAQAANAMVVEECESCPTVVLRLRGPQAPLRGASGRTRFGLVGTGLLARDTDRGPIHAFVHVRDGRLAEIEVVRADGTAIGRLPQPEDFVVMPSPDTDGVIHAPWEE